MADLLERDLPVRACVFECVDLDGKEPHVEVDVDDMDRCAARVQQASAVSRDEVAFLAGHEFVVGSRVRVGLVDPWSHWATGYCRRSR